MDKSRFPRDKTCAGWITPQVVDELKLDVEDYSRGRVFQPIDSFQVGILGRPGIVVRFDHAVSFGIRRCEFDDYLLHRSAVRCRLGEPVKTVERTSQGC
jgi:menaquinone-9 beta-reductase